MIEFAALGRKIYKYLIDDGDENKKAESTRKFFIKRTLKFEDRKYCQKQLEKVDPGSLRKNH